MGIGYKYSQTTCPNCGANLTEYEGIMMIIANNAGYISEVKTNLNEDGILQDVADLVFSGQHSETLCGKCEQSMIDQEEQFDPKEHVTR